MFKSFIEWLTTKIPIPNWVIIIWLLAFVVYFAVGIGAIVRKGKADGT